MANNEILVEEDEPPTPQEQAELATEQEHVREMVENAVRELNTYLTDASGIGMMVEMREFNVEVKGGCLHKRIEVVRTAALVGFRRRKK